MALESMILSTLKPVGFIACASSMVQGAIWATAYVFALVTHYCGLVPRVNSHITVDNFFKNYVANYLQGSKCTERDSNLFCTNLDGSNQIAVWLYLATLSNIFWFISSLVLFVGLWSSIKRMYLVYVNFWISTGIVNLMVDFGISVVFLVDLSTISNNTCYRNNPITYFILTVMFLFSARGILLWIANLAFILYFIMVSYSILNVNSKIKELDSNWPSTSDSSYEFGSNQDDNEVNRKNSLGIDNLALDPVYSLQYTSKSGNSYSSDRGLNGLRYNNYNMENNYPPPKPAHQYRNSKMRDDVYHAYNHSLTNRKAKDNQSIGSFDQDAVLREITLASSRQPIRKSLTENALSDYDDERKHSEYNQNNTKYISKTLPPPRPTPIPVPPPLPPKSDTLSRNTNPESHTNKLNKNVKFEPDQFVEPDYSPELNARKSFDINSPMPKQSPVFTYNEAVGKRITPKLNNNKSNIHLTLHEAIRNRPPLRQVVRNLNGESKF